MTAALSEQHERIEPALDAALAYAAKGWRVFPCNPTPDKKKGSKAPLPPVYADKDADGNSIEGSGWPRKASHDADVLRRWWRQFPKAMIGMAPGWAGGFVVDLDPKGEPVEAVEARLVEAVGPLPANVFRAKTQSGGVHLWFSRPLEGCGNHSPGLPNIDIRCDAGYVIMPPSQLANGNSYEWITAPFDPALAPPVPPRLLTMIRERQEKAHAPVETNYRPVAANDQSDAVRHYALKALDGIRNDVAGAVPGYRGKALFAGAARAGQFAACGAFSESEAMAALLDGANACGLVKDDGARSVERDIRRGVDVGRGDAGDVVKLLDGVRADADARRHTRSTARQGARLQQKPERQPVTHVSTEKPAATPANDDWPNEDAPDGEAPSSNGLDKVDMAIVESCAPLDHSDTDNSERLIRHFGEDLSILAQDGVPGGDWLAWTGTHWDLSAGAAKVRLIVQKLGGRIGLEAGFLDYTPEESAAIEKAMPYFDCDEENLSKAQKAIVKAGAAAIVGLLKRKAARRSFGVSSKNHARMEKALECASPRLRRNPDMFNPDRYKVATLTHTLSFVRERDPECPDPDTERFTSRVEAKNSHDREDWITAVMPVEWHGKKVPAKRWRAFLEEMLPDADKRRTVQQYSGLGLLGVPVQYMMFHYGLGANGKSVFLETLTRILGPGLAVGLPRESIVGASERSAGGASPDLVRLYGKRMVRILEVKADVPLQEDLIKKLTGGEAFPVRTLFKGFFEFQNFATAHMSGNGFPTVDGTDNGIWRRLLVVHWDKTIPEERRRDFEEVVSEFTREEGAGILAWLVEGVLDFLANGLFIAPSVRQDTSEYREEMDPIGEFVGACVLESAGDKVQALTMYEAYVSWSMANAKRARTNTKFGRTLAQRFNKSEVGGRLFYLDCKLHSVPPRPDPQPAFGGG